MVALNYGGIKCWMLFLFSANLYYSSTSPYSKMLTPSVRNANILHSHAFSGNSQTFMSTVFLIRRESTKQSSWTHSCMTCMISSPRPHRPCASLHSGMFQVLHCLSPVVHVTSVCIGFTCWCAVLNWDVRCSRKLFSLIQYNSAWFLVFFPPLLLLPQNSFLSHPSSTFKPPGKQKPCLFKILSFQC